MTHLLGIFIDFFAADWRNHFIPVLSDPRIDADWSETAQMPIFILKDKKVTTEALTSIYVTTGVLNLIYLQHLSDKFY